MGQIVANIFENETEICNEIAKILLEDTGAISILKDDPDRFVLTYDDSTYKGGNKMRGLGNVFKLGAILNMFNNYFANQKIDLKASESIINGIIHIKFEKFMRMNLVSRDIGNKKNEDIGRNVIDITNEKYDIFKKETKI